MTAEESKPARDDDKERSVTIGIRIPQSLRFTLEDAAYLTDQALTEIIVAGITHQLDLIRKEKGDIPPRPRRQKSLPPAEPQTPEPAKKGRRAK
jgi:hypothetical protein